MRTRHFQLPPNKRVNFSKLGIAAPFRPPWTTLLKDWRADVGFSTSEEPQPELKILRDEAALERLRLGQLTSLTAADQLVAVRLQVTGKGCLGENTIICIPSQQDLESKLISNILTFSQSCSFSSLIFVWYSFLRAYLAGRFCLRFFLVSLSAGTFYGASYTIYIQA